MTRSMMFLPALLVALPSVAAINLATPASTYSETFDSLAATGTANAWTNDSNLAGWSLFNLANVAVATYRANDGTSNTGAIYSYGTTGSSERAFGGVASSGFSGWIALALTNTSGNAFDSVTLQFDGEQWRNGGNASLAAQSMTLQYGYGASFTAVSTWVSPGGSFDWASPVTTATGGAINGNTAGTVPGRGGTLVTNWGAGDTLWVRWAEVNDAGNDHGLAIDNLRVSVTAVPEPGPAALLFAGLATMAWRLRRRG